MVIENIVGNLTMKEISLDILLDNLILMGLDHLITEPGSCDISNWNEKEILNNFLKSIQSASNNIVNECQRNPIK